MGARFDDRVTGKVESFSPHSRKIHIDIDPTSIAKSVPVDIPIVGDVKNVLKEMLKDLEEEPPQDYGKIACLLAQADRGMGPDVPPEL